MDAQAKQDLLTEIQRRKAEFEKSHQKRMDELKLTKHSVCPNELKSRIEKARNEGLERIRNRQKKLAQDQETNKKDMIAAKKASPPPTKVAVSKKISNPEAQPKPRANPPQQGAHPLIKAKGKTIKEPARPRPQQVPTNRQKLPPDIRELRNIAIKLVENGKLDKTLDSLIKDVVARIKVR